MKKTQTKTGRIILVVLSAILGLVIGFLVKTGGG